MKETNCHTYNYCKLIIIIIRSQGTIHCYSRVYVVMEKDEEEDLYCIYTLIEIDRRRRRIHAITKKKWANCLIRVFIVSTYLHLYLIIRYLYPYPTVRLTGMIKGIQRKGGRRRRVYYFHQSRRKEEARNRVSKWPSQPRREGWAGY